MAILINITSRGHLLPTKTQMKAWLQHCFNELNTSGSVHIDFVDARAMKALNAQYRQKDYPTNVLSFPADIPLARGKRFFGAIILCPEVCVSEAIVQDKTLPDHIAHLLIHGYLHLLGFDHIKKVDAKKMERWEVRLLNQLGIENPYE